MTDILLHWLNEEIKLSKPIASIQADFRTGYLYAELLHKLGQIPSLSIFRQSSTEEDIIHNFCRLDKTLLDMNIVLTKTDRNNIIAGKNETAMIFLFKIRQYLSHKHISLSTLKSQKSKELHDIYRNLQFKTDKGSLNLHRKEQRQVEQVASNDSTRLKMKFKHLKLNDDDLRMIKEGEEDMKVFDNYHSEILGLERRRCKDKNDRDGKEQQNWKTAFNEIKLSKKKMHEESIRELLFYRDATIQYMAQSATDSENTIRLFNNNLSKLGLDIPGASEMKTGPKVSTDIIMMRMKEVMNQKATAKKEKEKRDRRRLKEEMSMVEAMEKKKTQQVTLMSSQHPVLSDGVNLEMTFEQKNTAATLSKDIHYNNVLIGDRIGFFKTVIPEQSNLRYDLADDYYSPSKEPFDKEGFINSINHLNYASSLRESSIKQQKRSFRFPFINELIGKIIDITEEAYDYQCDHKEKLIDESQWAKWIDSFTNDLPIVEVISQEEEEEALTNEVNYDRSTVEITEREENEMFNYIHYLEEWSKGLIPNEVKGKQLKFAELLGDLIRGKQNSIEEYEPTENEIDILTIPKELVTNVPFGELIEAIVDMKFPQGGSNKAVNRFDCLPIKLALCGYPLSGHRTQAKLISEAYPNIKVYHLTSILNEYMETYERLNKPIEEHPKYKPNKKGLVEQLQMEVNKEKEQFASKEQLIKPYIEAKANNADALPLDSVMLSLLINKLNEDFPSSQSPVDSMTDLHAKIAKKKEMMKKIEQFKQEELSTKKSKAKEVQAIQKDIDKLIPELYYGFFIVDFPQTKKQCALIENYFTGYIPDIDKPLSEKAKVLNSFSYSIDSQPHLPALTSLERSGFDFIINLAVSSTEIERRYSGIRYDPSTKVYYHLEDSPPKESDKKVIERLVVPPEYANSQYAAMKEHYERNINEMRSFYSNFGVDKYKTRTFQTIPSERKANEIFEDITSKLIEGKMKQIEDEQEEEAEALPPSTNNFSARNIQFNPSMIESSSPSRQLGGMDTPRLRDSEGRGDKRRTVQSLKEMNFVTPYVKYSAFNQDYLNECKMFFWFIAAQKSDIISHLSMTQTKFIHFLSSHSQKAELTTIYVQKFNAFLENHGKYKSYKKVLKEFSNDIQDLNEKLWAMIQTKKVDAINQLEAEKQSPYRTTQIGHLLDYTKSLFMIETRKYLTSVDVLRHYYDSVHSSFTLPLQSTEDLFEGILPNGSFKAQISKLHLNCFRLIYKQDEQIKELEKKIRESTALNETNVSIRKRRKNNLTCNTHLVDRDFYFYEEEVKQMLRTEKDKYKYRITLLKYFVLSYSEVIGKLFDDVANQLDSWIISSIEAQNSVLNELMFHLNDRLRKGECAELSFEFDSFDIYRPLDVKEAFILKEAALADSDYAYSVKAFQAFYEDVKQYTTAPQLISRRAFIDVVIKRCLLKKKEGTAVISKALGSISYHSFALLMKLLELAMDHSTYEKANQNQFETIKEVTEDKKETLKAKGEESGEKANEASAEGEKDKEEVIVLGREQEQEEEEREEVPQYDTYLNLSQAFVILALINSKLIGVKEERELREELKGKVTKSTQITREAFCQLDFWFETDEYLQTPKEGEPEKEEKISLIKNMLFTLSKDDTAAEDEINIEAFLSYLTFSNANSSLMPLIQSERAKEPDHRCTYLSFLTHI